MSQPRRDGAHPLDEQLYESGMLDWVVPSLQLLIARIVTIAPFAVAMAAYVWLAPKLMLSTPFHDSGWREFIDAVVRTAIVTAILLSGYVALARAEGRPYGVGAILPARDCVARAAAVTVFWSIAGWLLGEVIQAILSSAPVFRLILNLVRLFDVWGVYLLLWVLSPLSFMLATVSGLTYIGAVRGNEALGQLFGNAFSLVFGQARRFLVPSLVIAGVLILVGHFILRVFARDLLRLFFLHGMPILMVFGAVLVLVTLPWWFVMERALRPELGVEDDPEPLSEMGGAIDDRGSQSSPAVTAGATVAAMSTPSTDEIRARFTAMAESEGALMAARRLVAELRGRRLDRTAFMAGLEALPADAPVLAEMAGLAESWREASRPGELAWLVRTGLKRDKTFLMDRPDTALAVAQRLVGQQQPQPASHLLLAFLNHHRRHPSHLDAGLRLARLLAFELDNVEGARRLLDKLEAGYPDNQLVQTLRRTLP